MAGQRAGPLVPNRITGIQKASEKSHGGKEEWNQELAKALFGADSENFEDASFAAYGTALSKKVVTIQPDSSLLNWKEEPKQ